nr:hypothetical protein [Tanacetum cinerariifolium]
IEGLSSWDMDKTTWGGRFKLFGTVPVCCRCTGKVNGDGLVLAGKLAGSRDCPSMLATERYPQWRSRFLRCIDTKPNGKALRKCILNGPYKPTTVLVQAVAATDDSSVIPEHTTVETPDIC